MSVAWRGTAARSAQLGGDPTVDISGLGIVDGDLLVAVCIASSGATVDADAAWGSPRAESLSAALRIWVRVASSEPASYTFTVPGATAASEVSISRFDGQAASNPIDFITAVSNTVATLVIPQGTSLGANRLLAQILLKGNSGTFTEPGTATERYDALSATQNFVYAGGDEVVGAGATGSRTWTASISSGVGLGVMVAIAPAPPGEGSFVGAYDFSGSGFVGEAGPGEGSFVGAYDFSGSGFTGDAPGVSSGAFTGGFDFSGSFTGQAPPGGDTTFTPGGRDRFTARRTPKNRRRSR